MITVLGGGSWGTALAHVLACAGKEPWLLVRNEEAAKAMCTSRENQGYLPGLPMHPGVRPTSDYGVLANSNHLVLAVPAQNQRQSLRQILPLLPAKITVINSSKGVELASLKLLSQVVAECLGDKLHTYAALSGPSFAKEVMQAKPTAVVLGCQCLEQGAKLRSLFSTSWFRAYSSPDLVGVELGGALKNIIAIAAGICDGLQLGDNARAALLTRGLAEISRLGQSLGASATTFMGLSGLGDLVLTCTGDLSRNRQVGLLLGQGHNLESITASMNMVAEGVKTTRAVALLTEKMGVDMPICSIMNHMLLGQISANAALRQLMTRALKAEPD